MDPGILVPLACFGFVVFIVAINNLSKIRDLEAEVTRRIYIEQMEHEKRMKGLELELERVKRV